MLRTYSRHIEQLINKISHVKLSNISLYKKFLVQRRDRIASYIYLFVQVWYKFKWKLKIYNITCRTHI